MARLDVHPMPGKGPGYVIDVQADLLSHIATCAVVPLLPESDAPSQIGELNPVMEIKGKLIPGEPSVFDDWMVGRSLFSG